MAFINKLGNLLKQSAVKHIDKKLSASMPSIYQAVRSMSSSKLFVGGISYSTDDLSLREAFARYGEIIDARVIMDRETGRSRGFAFITYASNEDASSAIQAMDGQDLHGRRIRVNYATERSRPGFGGGSFYGSGGGYAGNYYGGDSDRTGSYGNGGYGSRGSYGHSSENYGVSDGAANVSNYQFNENSSGDTGFGSGGFSSNSGLGSDDVQFGGSKEERGGLDNGLRENNDEPDDHAQTQK